MPDRPENITEDEAKSMNLLVVKSKTHTGATRAASRFVGFMENYTKKFET